jgi:glycerol-3-phosphate O-acyltransferase/dihydroxyacetone phosphate acyltransferase
MVYLIVRTFARLLLGLFYRRIEVIGSEHIPGRGPLIIAANHHNALVDAMLVMTAVPRRLVIIAAAPLFRNPVIGPWLRLVGALPVLRRQEGVAGVSRNDSTLGAVATALQEGGTVLVFPEGLTQPEPVLRPLHTGAARMLFSVGETEPAVTLLPVGLVFHEPGTFRSGWALVLVGPPVPTADLLALHRSDPDRAVHELTGRLAKALGDQIIEADDRQTLRLMRVVETLWRGDGASPASVAGVQQVARAYRRLLERAPERLVGLRQRVESYQQDLEQAGVRDGNLTRAYPTGVALRWAIREALSLVLSLPLALVGMLIHWPPYRLIGWSVRVLPHGAAEEATYKIIAGVVVFPLCWIGEGVAAWALGGGWALGALLIALPPTGFLALAWQERLARVRREARAFFRFLLDRDLRRRLVARRQALVDELAALAALAEQSDDAPSDPRRS